MANGGLENTKSKNQWCTLNEMQTHTPHDLVRRK